MRRFRTLIVLSFLCLGRERVVPAAEEMPLFNGRDLAGWTFRGSTPGAENPFYVQEGTLCCKGKPVGYLRTDTRYTHYTVTVEWRWPKESKPGNNGVLLAVQDGEHFYNNVWPKSIEAQLAHGHAGDILTIGEFPLKTGRNKGRYTPVMRPSNEKPQGEWNQFEATLRGGSLKILINGVLQNEATEVWETPGYIALQSEGAPIEFRNIRLIPLGP